MNLSLFLDGSIQGIMETAARFYGGDRPGRAFLTQAVRNQRKSSRIRASYEQKGQHIPPFLIASIAADCNLRCAGCYAWASGSCEETQAEALMQVADWRRLFAQARELGIAFILLAGGEPLLRRELIELAADFPEIIFPIFTNGTLIDSSYLALFEAHRNLIPLFSIEGEQAQTDARRGSGIANQVQQAMQQFQTRGLLYGTSITVTTANLETVTAPEFVAALRQAGCGLITYVEYVPMEAHTEQLVLDEADLARLEAGLTALRQDKRNSGLILLSFPGDEDRLGGCLAAGRGFFHINPQGGAEPCPFSPYSTHNLKEHSLLNVLQSPFFARIRQISTNLTAGHPGGCSLFVQQEQVRASLHESTSKGESA